jgi:uncharacterized protein YaiE (UPF0345 family)
MSEKCDHVMSMGECVKCKKTLYTIQKEQIETLKKYVQHTEECSQEWEHYKVGDKYYSQRKCTCGLEKALTDKE